MKPIRIAAIGAFIGTALLLPTAVQAHWRLRPATPLTPLAFTWPAVREANDWAMCGALASGSGSLCGALASSNAIPCTDRHMFRDAIMGTTMFRAPVLIE